MSVLEPSDLLDCAHVLQAKVESNGAISVTIGDVISQDSIDQAVPVFQHWGWVSLPAVPEPGKGAAEAIVWKTSASDVSIAGRDVRGMSIAGNMVMGEACAYAPGSQACTMYKIGGGITHFTTIDNTVTGQTVMSETAPDGFKQFAPWGKSVFDATGFHVTNFSGAQFHLGGVSGVPAPLSSLGAYAMLSAPMVKIEGSVIVLGNSFGLQEPIAKASSLLNTLDSIASALSGIQAALATIATGTTPAPLPANVTIMTGAITAAGVAVSAASAAITASHLLVPSSTTSVN